MSAGLNRPAGSWTGYPNPNATNLVSEQEARSASVKFPGIGDSVAKGTVNQSGAPSPNTKPVPKKATVSAGAVEAATAVHKANIAERLGAKHAPQVGVSQANAPEASLTGRNVKIVPSSVGNRDFYDRRG